MKKLACKNMGMACDFVAEGETAEEVKEKMMAHAKMAHADMLNNMSDMEKEGMMKKMDEKMTEA